LEGLAICSNNQFVKTILGINEYSIIIFTVKSKQKYLNLETKVGADEAALPNVKKTKRLLPVLHDNQIRERKKENWL
jgi:hypothetical protein